MSIEKQEYELDVNAPAKKKIATIKGEVEKTDGKEKHKTWIEVDIKSDPWTYLFFGYGKTREEAIKSSLNRMKKTIEELTEAYNQIKNHEPKQ